MSTQIDNAGELAKFYTNVAYILADVCNTFAMNAENELGKVRLQLREKEKQQFGALVTKAKELKVMSKQVASSIYRIDQVEQACEDSDWLYEFILLLIDRTGENEDKMTKARAMIFIMLS